MCTMPFYKSTARRCRAAICRRRKSSSLEIESIAGQMRTLLAKIEAVLVAKGSAADEEEWEVVPAAAGEVAPADVPADVPAAAGAE